MEGVEQDSEEVLLCQLERSVESAVSSLLPFPLEFESWLWDNVPVDEGYDWESELSEGLLGLTIVSMQSKEQTISDGLAALN